MYQQQYQPQPGHQLQAPQAAAPFHNNFSSSGRHVDPYHNPNNPAYFQQHQNNSMHMPPSPGQAQTYAQTYGMTQQQHFDPAQNHSHQVLPRAPYASPPPGHGQAPDNNAHPAHAPTNQNHHNDMYHPNTQAPQQDYNNYGDQYNQYNSDYRGD